MPSESGDVDAGAAAPRTAPRVPATRAGGASSSGLLARSYASPFAQSLVASKKRQSQPAAAAAAGTATVAAPAGAPATVSRTRSKSSAGAGASESESGSGSDGGEHQHDAPRAAHSRTSHGARARRVRVNVNVNESTRAQPLAQQQRSAAAQREAGHSGSDRVDDDAIAAAERERERAERIERLVRARSTPVRLPPARVTATHTAAAGTGAGGDRVRPALTVPVVARAAAAMPAASDDAGGGDGALPPIRSPGASLRRSARTRSSERGAADAAVDAGGDAGAPILTTTTARTSRTQASQPARRARKRVTQADIESMSDTDFLRFINAQLEQSLAQAHGSPPAPSHQQQQPGAPSAGESGDGDASPASPQQLRHSGAVRFVPGDDAAVLGASLRSGASATAAVAPAAGAAAPAPAPAGRSKIVRVPSDAGVARGAVAGAVAAPEADAPARTFLLVRELIRRCEERHSNRLDLSDTLVALRERPTRIPDDVFRLHELRELLVRGNELGQLPHDVERLVGLHTLDVSRNPLGMSTLPDLTALTRLTRLAMCQCELAQWPRAVLLMPNLLELDLSRNSISIFPPDLHFLRGLRRLDVSHNRLTVLTTLPSSRCFDKLEYLDVSSNTLMRIDVEHMVALKELSASNNQLTHIPDSTARHWTRLQSLNLSYNTLARLPREASKWRALRAIDIRSNQFRFVPGVLAALRAGAALRRIRSDGLEDEPATPSPVGSPASAPAPPHDAGAGEAQNDVAPPVREPEPEPEPEPDSGDVAFFLTSAPVDSDDDEADAGADRMQVS